MAPRIGFIIIGHHDYQNDIGEHFAYYARAREQYWPFQDTLRQEAEQ